jgi:hypothetical protein
LGTGKIFEDGDKIEELVIMGVREPAADWYRVLRMEYIGCRRVINNNCVSKVTTDLGKVLREGVRISTLKQTKQTGVG